MKLKKEGKINNRRNATQANCFLFTGSFFAKTSLFRIPFNVQRNSSNMFEGRNLKSHTKCNKHLQIRLVYRFFSKNNYFENNLNDNRNGLNLLENLYLPEQGLVIGKL